MLRQLRQHDSNLNNLDNLTSTSANQGYKTCFLRDLRPLLHKNRSMHVVPIRASSPQQIERRLTGHQAPNGFEHKLTGHQAPNLNAYVGSVKCHNNQQLNQLRQLLTTHVTLTRRQGLYITTS